MIAFNPRQQEAIAFPRNTVVNASAGTGKTATLVGVFLAQLVEGTPPGQILAITFTEKAAAELRHRLKREVLARAAQEPAEGAPGMHWNRALTGLSNVPISTIHAFCAWLLKENALEAGVDPHFTIWDEDESSGVRRDVILDVVRQQICAGHRGVQALFRHLQLVQPSRHAPQHLTEVIEAALRWLNGLGVDLQRRDLRGRNWLEDRLAAQRAMLAEMRRRFEQGCQEVLRTFRRLAGIEAAQGKNAQAFVQRIRADLTSIEASLARLTPDAPVDVAEVFEALTAYLTPGNLGKNSANEPVRAGLATLRQWLGKDAGAGGLAACFGALHSAELTQELIAVIGQVQAEYARRKAVTRSLDFDDLLTRARDLLKCHPTVRRRYKARFKAILVDEFQDTDELQGEIIALLGEDCGREQTFHPFERYRTLLDQIVLDATRLFIVGDPKQSIYRFRRADVGVFVSMTEKIVGTGGNGVALVENYRSAPDILTFVNTLFGEVMNGGGAHALPPQADTRHRMRYKAQDHLQPGPDTKAGGRLILLVAEEGTRAEAGRALEARALAALIDELSAEGTLQSYRDMAILLKTNAFGQLYEDALRERSIPFYRVKGGGFFRRQEVSDLTELLAFLVDPADDLALATVLTSPLAGLDFAALYRLCDLRQPGMALSTWLWPGQLADLPVDLQARLQPFATLASGLLRLRDRLDPAELLEWVIHETGYDAVLMAQAGGEQHVANVDKLLDLARGFSRQGLAGLHNFVAYLQERLGEDPPRTPDAQILSEEEDVVRLMTIHQAKGLEFGAVCVPDLSHAGHHERGNRVLFDERWGVMCAASYGINRTRLPHPLMLETELLERDKEIEEQKRLLYVALTRAKQVLVMGEGAPGGDGLWRSWLLHTIAATPEAAEVMAQVRSGTTEQAVIEVGGVTIELRRAAALVQRPVSRVVTPQFPLPPTVGELAAIRERVWGWQPPPPLMIELSPTALATLAKCQRYFFLREIAGLEEQPPGQDGGFPAVDKGRIVHEVLERVATNLAPEDVPAHVRDLLKRESGAALLASAEAEGLAQDLERYLQSSVWQALRTNPTLRREVPFTLFMRREGLELCIRGRMDAVAMCDGMPVVIDHKYAQFNRHAEAGYEVPMAIYALAAMRALESPRAEVQLSFLRSHVYPTETRTIGLAEQVEERLLQLAQDYVNRRHDSDVEHWPRIPRQRCDLARCGFRPFCWGREEP